VVAVDSTQPQYRYVPQGFLRAFEHFGMPYLVLDLSRQEATLQELTDASAPATRRN
jgi:hypothetical protein